VEQRSAAQSRRNLQLYAHQRGIKIIAGFNWGWGYKRDISSAEGRAFIKKLALDAYREEYLGRPIDGIYFQTETEHKTQEINGRSVAVWCCDMVNEIAREFYAIDPHLSIRFGLHATSIRSHRQAANRLCQRATKAPTPIGRCSSVPVRCYREALSRSS
jgi:hypothetical protein